jgi:hypothetical protein
MFTVPVGEVKSIRLTWVYAGNPPPVNVTVSPGTPCPGDRVSEPTVTVKVATWVNMVGAWKVHPQRVEVTALMPLSLTKTVCGPALRAAGTRAVTLNLPLPETGAVIGAAPPIETLTVPVSELLMALVVGIHPDPVIPNSVFVGPADGDSVMVGAATVQVPVLYTAFAGTPAPLSVATTVYVPGSSGGTTMVVVIVPLGGIAVGPVIGAQIEPNITVARFAPVWVNPEPWRVIVDPAVELEGVSVIPNVPTVMSAFAELLAFPTVSSGPAIAHT